MSAAVTGAALASLAFTATAGAATKVSAAPRARVEHSAHAQSPNFAGYAVSGLAGAAVTSAFAGFTVPSVTCAATESSGVVPMAEVFNSNGTAYAAGGVFVACSNGKPVYQSYIAINNYVPTTLYFKPAAGDKISAAVKQTSAGATVTLKDITQKRSQTLTLFGSLFAGSDDTSNIGVSGVTMNGVNVPNCSFGAFSFTRAWTNGVSIGTLPNTAYDEATPTSTGAGPSVQIMTSPLSKAGNWFRTTLMRTPSK